MSLRYFALLSCLLLRPTGTAAAPVDTELHRVDWQVVVSGLDHPWSLAFLPDGRLLITERVGRLRLVEADGRLHPKPIAGLPPIHPYGQGGLLDGRCPPTSPAAGESISLSPSGGRAAMARPWPSACCEDTAWRMCG